MSNDKQITLNDLNYFWLPNGAPCFLANNIDICEQIESLGFQIYYLIGHKGTTSNSTTTYKAGVPSTTVQNTTYKSKMFKVVNNFVGRAVSEVEEDFGPELVVFKEEAHYTMPAIPHIIIDKLDEFFRLIHAKHGSESIVLLTYDTTKEGSEGWGILVPEQTNTATHCKYDPDSVVDLKEDHVMIVGSVHSHPEMPAYASGTDHDDQADFDGLHITYGWQKSVANGATQYHLELQMGGTSYTLTAKDVFEDFIFQKEPDPEVLAWSDKVKKAFPPQPALAGVTTLGTGIIPLNQPATIPPAFIAGGSRKPDKRTQVIPFDRNMYPGSIAAEIDISGNASMICPSCLLALFKTEVYQGSACPACDIPIVAMNNDIEDIINSIDIYNMERNFSTFASYYLWATDGKQGEDFIMLVKPADVRVDSTLSNRSSSFFGADDILEDESIFDEDPSLDIWSKLTLCCGMVIDDETTLCACPVTVLPDDIQDFDEALSAQNIKMYDAHSVCESCAHYYLPSCPEYRNAVVKFAVEAELPKEPLYGCPSWEAYKNSSDYSMEGWENYGV
jgi:hypothetical protein